MSTTLHEALSESGFDEGAAAPGAPNLERPLTSSDFAASSDVFVAAYYYADETSSGTLGPLHLSRFDRRDGRWLRGADIADDTRGSVTSVQITPKQVLVEVHATPSAGYGIVLASATLAQVASLSGFSLTPLADGSIAYVGNMIHFAPPQQERFRVFDPSSRKDVEVFPGGVDSEIARGFRREIRRVYGGLPEKRKAEDRRTVYGPVDDFDRTIGTVHEREGGGRIAFGVTYDCMRLHDEAPQREAFSIVRCDRRKDGAWFCGERRLESTARRLGVPLTRNPSGSLDQKIFDALAPAVLADSPHSPFVPRPPKAPDK